MSRETLTTLNTSTLIGFTTKRGNAWHHRANLQGAEPNHYPDAIPVGDVERRLFHWEATPRRVAVEVPADLDTCTHVGDDGAPMRWDVQGDRQAITRSDTHATLGIFTTDYAAHQYRQWLLRSVSSILGDTLHIGSAGVLRAGAVAWVSVEVPETLTTPEGVAFRPHLLAATSLDGSLSTTYKRVVTNTVCDNTMAAALSEAGQELKVRHTRHSELRIDQARDALALIHQTADDFTATVAQLCALDVNDRQWEHFLTTAVPRTKDGAAATTRAATAAEKKRAELRRLYRTDPRVQPWAGTAWGVVQALNTWNHHLRGVRGTERAERNMTRSLTGDTQRDDRATLATLHRILQPA